MQMRAAGPGPAHGFTALPVTAPGSRYTDIANTKFAAVLLFVVTAILHYQLREPAPYDLLLIATAGLLFMLGLRIPRGIALPASLLALVLLGYMIASTSALYIDMSITALQTSTYLTLTFVFFAAIVAASPDYALRAIWGGFLVAGLSAALLGIGGYLGAVPGGDILLVFGRAKALFQDPNIFGPFLVAPILYAVWRMTTRRVAAALFFWGPIATVMVVGLFLSFSRGAWIHLAVSAIVMAALLALAPETRRQRGRIVLIAIVMAGMLTLAIGWALTLPDVRDILEMRLGLQSYDTREGGRFSGQLDALKMALSNPFGIGAANWGMIAQQDTHNVYLNVFVNGGFLSLMGLISAFALTMIRGFGYAMRGPRRGVFIVAYATLAGLFGEAVIIDINHWRHLYLLMGIVWGLMLAAPPQDQPRQATV